MRIIKCDICDTEFDTESELIIMAIPGSYLPDADEDDTLQIDVCGWDCVRQMANTLHPKTRSQSASGVVRTEEKEGEQTEPEPERFMLVPQAPTIDTSMDEKTLAKYTEQVTGVKRR